jgi:hypothetical protein
LEWSQAKEAIAKLRSQAQANGRDPNSLEISLFNSSIPDEKTISEMEAGGVKRFILTVFADNRQAALPKLDQLAKVKK